MKLSRRGFSAVAAFSAILVVLGVVSSVLEKEAAVQASGLQAPKFEVDPLWPKPLPNHWLLGMTIGVSVDSQDHVWIVHRQDTLDPKEAYMRANPPASNCCQPAPPVLAFDQAGNLIAHRRLQRERLDRR
jgi:hypothetical protein